MRNGGPTLFRHEVSENPPPVDRDGGDPDRRASRLRAHERSWPRVAARIGSRGVRCVLGCADSNLAHPGREGGQTVGPGAGRVVRHSSRRSVRALPHLAVATRQARPTCPHRGGGPCTNRAPRLQRAPAPVGRGLRALDCSRGTTWRPSVGAPWTGGAATPASLGPTPFFVVDRGGGEESRLVE